MTYLHTFFSEKKIPNTLLEVAAPNGTPNLIDSDMVIEMILSAPKAEQDAIARNIRIIDFVNGDVLDYIRHLAKAIAKDIPSEGIERWQPTR